MNSEAAVSRMDQRRLHGFILGTTESPSIPEIRKAPRLIAGVKVASAIRS